MKNMVSYPAMWLSQHLSSPFFFQELIKKYGAKNYNFPQFKAHYRKQITKTDKPFNPMYEPPGYHADIASGIYQPDSKRPQVLSPKILVKRL